MGPILNKMKSCFMVATRDAHKLDEAMARHFQPVGVGDQVVVVQADFSKCGTCPGNLDLKQEQGNDGRKLLYCNACQVGHLMPRKGLIRPKTAEDNEATPILCPICNFQVVAIARGDGYEGQGYTLCPKCYGDPPPEHGGNGGTFACFSCTHPTCALAGGTRGGDVEVFSCPFCREGGHNRGKVSLRKNSRGYILSCSNYSAREKCKFTIWLPKASRSVSVSESDDNICARCSTNGPVKKVSFVWKPGGVPPHLGRETTACILCDRRFREDVQIDLPSMNHVRTNNRQHFGGGAGRGSHSRQSRTTNPGRTNSRNASRNSSGNAANGNANNVVCYICNQPGHYSNACPSRNQ